MMHCCYFSPTDSTPQSPVDQGCQQSSVKAWDVSCAMWILYIRVYANVSQTHWTKIVHYTS